MPIVRKIYPRVQNLITIPEDVDVEAIQEVFDESLELGLEELEEHYREVYDRWNWETGSDLDLVLLRMYEFLCQHPPIPHQSLERLLLEEQSMMVETPNDFKLKYTSPEDDT